MSVGVERRELGRSKVWVREREEKRAESSERGSAEGIVAATVVEEVAVSAVEEEAEEASLRG